MRVDLNIYAAERVPVAKRSAADESECFERSHMCAMRLLAMRTIRRTQNARSNATLCADIVIAVPARNERERIERCVQSLCALSCGAHAVKLLFLVNNSDDGTAEWLHENVGMWPIAADVVEVYLPSVERSAGRARWLANHAAVEQMNPDGFLFMTDADSCVPLNWIERYGALLDNGWDAVAGGVDINRADCDQIVASLDERNQLEGRYTALLDEIEALIDPVEHDPWPRHFNASGANTAARVAAIRCLRDFPRLACGEDRAFIRSMEALDLRVRHDVSTPVHTSGRLFGRADGGMADTLRHRTHVPDSPCDERLERADQVVLHASLRAMWRGLYVDRNADRPVIEQFANNLRLSLPVVACAAEISTFGASWQALEMASPRLARRPVSPCQLPLEIQRADDLLQAIRHGVVPEWDKADIEMRA